MLREGEIAERIQGCVLARVTGMKVSEVRIGVSYAAVTLDNKFTGLAAVMRENPEPHCGVVAKAGTLVGIGGGECLSFLKDGGNPVEKALGLAAANAALSIGSLEEESDAVGLMNLSPADHVVMVGLFRPLVPRIDRTGARLSVLENEKSLPGIVSFRDRGEILKTCSVAIITATSILNGTLETILNELGTPRWVSLLGPSTPLCKEIFLGTPVSHLGGSAVLDQQKVMQIVSEGGGTPLLRPYLRFVNLLL